MIDREEEAAASSDDVPDLRYTSQDDGRVRIERELDGSGRLARGDSTHLHSIRFNARGIPRPREKQAPVDHQQAPATVPPVFGSSPSAGIPTQPTPPATEDSSSAGVAQRLVDWMLRRASR